MAVVKKGDVIDLPIGLVNSVKLIWPLAGVPKRYAPLTCADRVRAQVDGVGPKNVRLLLLEGNRQTCKLIINRNCADRLAGVKR